MPRLAGCEGGSKDSPCAQPTEAGNGCVQMTMSRVNYLIKAAEDARIVKSSRFHKDPVFLFSEMRDGLKYVQEK